MVINDKDFCEKVHMEIHAVRRISGYKPSIMEKNISRIVIEKFSPICSECKEVGEMLVSQPKKTSFFDKLSGALD